MTDDTPIGTESMVDLDGVPPAEDTTRIIFPGPHLAAKPRVLSREADDVAFMSPEVLREKLRRAGYQEPICGHFCRGCSAELPAGAVCGAYCYRCAEEIAAVHAEEGISWSTIGWFLFGAVIVIAAVVVGVVK